MALEQTLSGLDGRITRILVAPAARQGNDVSHALRARVGSTLQRQARRRRSAPAGSGRAATERGDCPFGLISLVVGTILTYNALLLASGERQAFVTYLTQLGAPVRLIVASLAFDALVMGAIGCALGLVLPATWCRWPPITRCRDTWPPRFPSAERAWSALSAAAIAVTAGMLAAFAAALVPAIRLLRGAQAETFTLRAPPLERRAAATQIPCCS